jgi:hypothetical protein
MDWLLRQWNDIKGNFKWAALVALWWLVVTLVKRMLHYFPSLPEWTMTAIPLVLSLGLFVWLVTRRPRGSNQGQVQNAAPLMNVTITAENIGFYVNRVDEFYQTYDNVMLRETEANILAIANTKPQAERERFFIRFIATGILNYVFDTIWFTIYASQIKALQTLNAKNLKREELRKFYSDAVASFPDAYKKYSFDQWLGYLRGQGLVIEQGDMVGITKRGREFLKYIVHQAKSLDIKKF